jgi:cell division protein FtsN
MLVKHIKNLLTQYDKVVVPHLGTFTSSYVHAEILTDKGEMMPPHKNITFYEYEVDEGGLLRNVVMQAENIDAIAFEKAIKDFTNDIKSQIAIFGQYEVKGLGKFSKNESGVLLFEQQGEQNFLGNSFGLPKVDYQPLKSSFKETVSTNPEAQPTPHTDSQNEKERNKTSELVWWLLVIPLLFIFGFLIYLFAQKDAMDRFKSFFNGSDVPVAVVSENKSYENFQKTKPDMVSENTDNTTTPTTDIPEPEKEDKDLLIKKRNQQNEQKNITVTTNNNNTQAEIAATGSYYVVLASFATYEKAQKMQNTLANKGISSKIVTNSEGKQLRVVYNQAFSSQEEATPILKEVGSKMGTELWVAKY